jgi:predicted ATP-dependent serine protease
VSHIESRIEEAHRLGFDRMLLPKSNADRRIKKTAMEMKAVANLADVMAALF